MKKLLATATLALAFLAGAAGDVKAWDTGHIQWGPQGAHYQGGHHPFWGNWYRSDAYGPGGVGGNHFQSPVYRGWSHWTPNGVQGAFSTPFLNGGKPIYWKY